MCTTVRHWCVHLDVHHGSVHHTSGMARISGSLNSRLESNKEEDARIGGPGSNEPDTSERGWLSYENGFKLKYLGNEIYYTA